MILGDVGSVNGELDTVAWALLACSRFEMWIRKNKPLATGVEFNWRNEFVGPAPRRATAARQAFAQVLANMVLAAGVGKQQRFGVEGQRPYTEVISHGINYRCLGTDSMSSRNIVIFAPRPIVFDASHYTNVENRGT